MCPSQLLPGKQHTVLVSNIADGGGYAYVGAGCSGEIAIPASKFCHKSKTFLKS